MPHINNLEGLDFITIKNSAGVSYAEFRKKVKADFLLTWWQIILGMVFLVLLFISPFMLPSRFSSWIWAGVLPASVLAGFTIAYLQLFVHEASHYHLLPNRKSNDRIANLLLCSWVGIDIEVYRKIHWKHHLGLSTPMDTENSYFQPLTPKFLLESFTGVHLFRILKGRNHSQLLTKAQRLRSWRMLVIGLFLNLTILLSFVLIDQWPIVVAWILSMLIFFPFFAGIRQLLEHRDESAGSDPAYYQTQQPKISRLFTESWASGLLGAAGFNRHLIHHWDPDLPFTALKKAEKFLSGCDQTKEIIQASKTSYIKTFRKLFTTHS